MDDDLYRPPSDFLQLILAEEVQLTGNSVADANLRKLITMMRDDYIANRDWATFILAQSEMDSPEIRAAFIRAADDSDFDVRGEAIRGLAKLAAPLALPFVQRELRLDKAGLPILEAAALCADASLIDDLRRFLGPTDRTWVDSTAAEAMAACESGVPEDL